MKSNKFWAILVLCVLMISVLISAVIFIYQGSGTVASVYQSGTLIKQIHLDTVSTPYTFVVESDDQRFNIISVEQGRICVTDASCPDHVCVNTGWISDGVIPIVCLPNELVIQIESASNNIDIAVQ